MRILFVVEAKDSDGTFRPRFGLDTMDRIKEWLEKYISAEMLAKTSEWRIVEYGPVEQEQVIH